jgi:hypothetical protein
MDFNCTMNGLEHPLERCASSIRAPFRLLVRQTADRPSVFSHHNLYTPHAGGR